CGDAVALLHQHFHDAARHGRDDLRRACRAASVVAGPAGLPGRTAIRGCRFGAGLNRHRTAVHVDNELAAVGRRLTKRHVVTTAADEQRPPLTRPDERGVAILLSAHSDPDRNASTRPSLAQADAAGSTTSAGAGRIFSHNAAASRAASLSSSLGVSKGSPFRDCKSSSKYSVWSEASANAGCSTSHLKKGTVVRIPSTRYSPSARRRRAMASARVLPHTASFEMSGS